jgi:arylsulfatase A-like enzyme
LSGRRALNATDCDNIAQQYQQRLRAVLAVDRLLGRIIAALGPKLDETTLIFTSDNGWLYGEHRVPGKIYPYEESARVPLYIAMPGANVPSTRRNLVLNNDLAPTILDIAKPGYTDALFDGRSLVAILREAQPPAWEDRQRVLIAFGRSQSDPQSDYHPTYSALRSRGRLYVESYDGLYYYPTQELIGLELYDLDNDPYEMNSLLHYPEDTRDDVLGSWLDLLSTCAGESCREYENAVDPP